ncbi:hypothetical protein D3C79_828290 [compost metagenome]
MVLCFKLKCTLEALQYFPFGNDFIIAPAIVVAGVHKFDEAQRDVLFFEVRCHRHNLRFVHASLHYHIHFDLKTGIYGMINMLQNHSGLISPPVHSAEEFRLQRIQTDIQPAESGII